MKPQYAPLVCVSLLLTMPALAAPPGDAPWTLAEAQRLAVQQSPLMEAARQGVEALQQQYEEAWWAWFPNLRLRSLATIIPPQGDSAPEFGPDLSDTNFWTKTDIEAYMPIYTFGKIGAVRRMAAHGVDAGNAALHIARAELRYQVARAWYGLALADELEELITDGEAELKSAREKLERMEEDDDDEYDQADMFRLRIYEARVRAIVLGNRRLRAVSRTGLRVALGLAPDAPLRIPKRLTLEAVPVQLKSLEDYVDLATRRRPELAKQRHIIGVKESDVDRKWAEFFPDFFLAGSFTVAASSVTENNSAENVFTGAVFNATGGGAAVGLQLTFDYPQKIARYRRAKAELARAQAELKGQQGLLRVELVSVWREAREKQALLSLQKRAMKAAHSLLTLKSTEYENGIDDATSFKDVLQAAVQYVSQKSEWLKAVQAFNLSIARLNRMVGTDVTQGAP